MRTLATAAAVVTLAAVTACGPPPPPPDDDAPEEAEEVSEEEQDDAEDAEPEEEEYDGTALAEDVDDALHAYSADLDWPEVAAMAEAVTLTSPEPGHLVVVMPEGEVPLAGDAGGITAEQCATVPDLEQVSVDHTASGGEVIGPVAVDC